MFNIETLRLAKAWLIAEIETDRVIVQEPYAIEEIRVLTDDSLRLMADLPLKPASHLSLLEAKKENGGVRPSVYIPWSERLLVNAAFIANYDVMVNALTGNGEPINYDRPMPQDVNDIYLMQDYRKFYNDFKTRIIRDENDGKHIIHCDIQNFAGTVKGEYLLNTAREIGFDDGSLSVIENALQAWSKGGVKGLPQGYALTDMALKLIMIPIDRVMRGQFPDIGYYRYVDDIQLSHDDEGRLKESYDGLQTILSEYGFALGLDKTVIAMSGTAGVRHSFNSQAFVDNHKQAVTDARCWEKPNWSDRELLQNAYQAFVYPGTAEDKPKYLVSYIFRQMKDEGVHDFLNDLPRLIDKYPERTFKLLKSAAKISNGERRPLNGFAYYFLALD